MDLIAVFVFATSSDCQIPETFVSQIPNWCASMFNQFATVCEASKKDTPVKNLLFFCEAIVHCNCEVTSLQLEPDYINS